MLSLSRLCLSWIPKTNYESPARLKWATYTFWYMLDPFLRRHFSYYRYKVRLDRALEKNNVMVNTLIGLILGATMYIGVGHVVLPPAIGASEHSMQENAKEVLELMGCDTTKELPAFQLMKVKREIIGKLHTVADIAEVRRQKEEVERMKTLLDQLKSSEGHVTTK